MRWVIKDVLGNRWATGEDVYEEDIFDRDWLVASRVKFSRQPGRSLVLEADSQYLRASSIVSMRESRPNERFER